MEEIVPPRKLKYPIARVVWSILNKSLKIEKCVNDTNFKKRSSAIRMYKDQRRKECEFQMKLHKPRTGVDGPAKKKH